MLHKLLQEQIQQYFNGKELPHEYELFIQAINDSYNHYENEYQLIVEALELNSQSLTEAYTTLQEETNNQRKILEQFIESLRTLKTENGTFQKIDTNNLLHITTFLKQQIEKQQETEKLYKVIVEDQTDLICRFQSNGMVTFANNAYLRYFNQTLETLSEKNHFSIFPTEEQASIQEKISGVTPENPVITYEQRVNVASRGLRWQQWTYRGVFDNKRLIEIQAVGRDTTEKKTLESQLLRSQRMQSIGTLANGIAHDMNNILTPILVGLQMVKRAADEKNKQRIEILESSAKRGAELVKQILSFSSGHEGQLVPISLKSLIREIDKFAKETFPKTINIQIHLSQDLWMILGNSSQLHQVIINLCVNARDAMPNGGTLFLSVENFTIDKAIEKIHIDAKVGPYIRIRVIDTGTGIPPENLERIFEPFFTTKAPGKGTGIGLTMVFSVVKGHGGFLNVHSKVGEGTIFEIFIPAVQEKLEDSSLLAKDESNELEATADGAGKLILVVDDEEQIRTMTSELLEMEGYKTVTAINGSDAIQVYSRHEKEIRLIVIDMMMPIMDGITCIAAIRKKNATLPFIAVSGLMDNEKIAKLTELGVTTAYSKPYSVQKLLQSIEEMTK